MENMPTSPQIETKGSTVPIKSGYQEEPDMGNINTIDHENNLDAAPDSHNHHTANSLVARMLWGHEKKASLNARVSEDGFLNLDDDIR